MDIDLLKRVYSFYTEGENKYNSYNLYKYFIYVHTTDLNAAHSKCHVCKGVKLSFKRLESSNNGAALKRGLRALSL